MKIKKYLTTILLIVLSLMILSTSVFAESTIISGIAGGKGSNEKGQGTTGAYSVVHTSGSDIVGMRCAVVTSTGTLATNSHTVDIYFSNSTEGKAVYNGSNEYANYRMFSPAWCKTQCINQLSGSWTMAAGTTVKNYNHKYIDTNIANITAIPMNKINGSTNPAINLTLDDWSKPNEYEKVKAIANLCGVENDSLSNRTITYEPLFLVKFENVGIVCTISEIGMYCIHSFGSNTPANTGDKASYEFIAEYLNKIFPNYLYCKETFANCPAQTKALETRVNGRTIVNSGLGVMIFKASDIDTTVTVSESVMVRVYYDNNPLTIEDFKMYGLDNLSLKRSDGMEICDFSTAIIPNEQENKIWWKNIDFTNGEIYNVYASTDNTSNNKTKINQDVTINNGIVTLNYYSLELWEGTGITSATIWKSTEPGGIFLDGQDVAISATVNTNYTWSCWAYTPDLSQIMYTKQELTIEMTEQKQLTAIATKNNSYNIEFRGNGSTSGYTQPMTGISFGETVTLNKNGYSKDGCDFGFWATTPDFSEMTDGVYMDQQEVSNLTEIDNDTIILYAQWSPHVVHVNYNANGGSIANNTVVDGNSLFLLNSMISYKKTVYRTYTTDFEYDDEKTLCSSSSLGLYRTGYHFLGWGTSANGNEIFSDGQTLTASGICPGVVSDDYTPQTIILYAIWETDKVVVNYYTDGGTLTGTQGNTADDITKVTGNKTGCIFTDTMPESSNYYCAANSGLWNYSTGAGFEITRTGYTARGKWNTKPAGQSGGISFAQDGQYWDTAVEFAQAAGATKVNGVWTVNLYAEWNINTIVINYHMNGATFTGSCSSSADKISDGTGDYYTKVNASSTDIILTDKLLPTSTYYAESGGGLWDYTKGSSLELTYAHHTALGIWNTQSDGNGISFSQDKGWATANLFANEAHASYSNGTWTVNLYAQWRDNTYTINFNGNGNTGGSTPPMGGIPYSKEIPLTPNGFTKTGNKFTGWNTQPDGKGTPYTDGQIISKLCDNDGDTITLYAQWTPHVLKVYYNTNGGQGSKSSTNATTGVTTYYKGELNQNIQVSSNNTTYKTYSQSWKYNSTKTNGLVNASTFGIKKTGFSFAGWSLVATEKDTTKYFDQNDATIVPTDLCPDIVSKDCEITLYAQWLPNTYHVYLYPNGGDRDLTSVPSGYTWNDTEKRYETSFVYTESIATIPSANKTFIQENGTKAAVGWLKENLIYEFTDTTYGNPQDISLYANWADKQSSVKYYINYYKQNKDRTGYDLYESEIKSDIESSQIGVDPKTYYGFTPEKTIVEIKDNESNVVKSSEAKGGTHVTFRLRRSEQYTINYYYQRSTCQLTYVLNGGIYNGKTDNVTETHYVFDTVLLLSPTKPGYVFSGWYTGTDDNGAYGFVGYNNESYLITGDTTLYAYWIRDPNAIDFEVVANDIYGNVIPKTDTTASCTVINHSFKDVFSVDKVSVGLRVINKMDSNKVIFSGSQQVCIPKKNKNLVYFKISIPDTVYEDDELVYTWTVDATQSQYVDDIADNNTDDTSITATSYAFNSIPETPDFSITSDSDYNKNAEAPETSINSYKWQIWTDNGSSYTKNSYQSSPIDVDTKLFTSTFTPTNIDGLKEKDDAGNYLTRSGYGFTDESVYIISSDVTVGTPRAALLLPEYNYLYKPDKFEDLEATVASTDVDATTYTLKLRQRDDENETIHYTPMWCQDGIYTAATAIGGMWSPIGEVQQTIQHTPQDEATAGLYRISNNMLTIQGSMYDDMYTSNGKFTPRDGVE